MTDPSSLEEKGEKTQETLQERALRTTRQALGAHRARMQQQALVQSARALGKADDFFFKDKT